MGEINETMKLIISVSFCFLALFLGSLFTYPNIDTYYAKLVKPSFTPPSWLFSPVWVTLFTLMGISLFLVWRAQKEPGLIRKGLVIFVIQVLLNVLWSFLFFGLRSPIAGFVDIVLLIVAVLLTIAIFWRISKISAVLLVPYIFWLIFAAILNFAILVLN